MMWKGVIASLCLLYLVLRLWALNESCLWFDEIFSIHAAEHSWSRIVPFVAKDLIHPPLFYFVLKIWIGMFGDCMLAVRLLPVVFSVLALFPFLQLCRELELRMRTMAVAVGLFAMNGALIKYAQEVRMYSMLLLVATLSIWLFVRFYNRNNGVLTLTIVNLLLVHTHYFGWFVVAAEVLMIIVARRKQIAQTLTMAGVVLVAFIPWVLAIATFAEPNSTVSQNIGWMQRPGILSVVEFFFDLFDPFYFQQSSAEPASNYLIALPLVLITAAAAGLYFTFRKDGNRDGGVLLMTWFLAIPLILVFVLSWLLPVSIWGSRHLLIVFPPMIILAAKFLSEAAPPAARVAFVAFYFVLSASGFAMHYRGEAPEYIWCAYEDLGREWTAAKTANSGPKTLYVFEDLVAYHYWFATRKEAEPDVVLIKGLEGIPNDTAYFLPRGFSGVREASLRDIDGDEVWLSFRQPIQPDPVGEHARMTRQFERPVTDLENLGYTVADVKKDVRGDQTAFLVRMKKAPTVTGP